MSEMLKKIIYYSNIIKNDRSLYSILAATTAELGELAAEVSVVNGDYPDSKSSNDKIPGEIADVLICLIDLLNKSNPDFQLSTFEIIVDQKLEKWNKVYNKGEK